MWLQTPLKLLNLIIHLPDPELFESQVGSASKTPPKVGFVSIKQIVSDIELGFGKFSPT
jgi:hypothetical protein